MKKINLALALFGLISLSANAQTILSEGFEMGFTDVSYSPILPDGWTTVDSYLGNQTEYRWSIYYSSKGTISGSYCAQCDAAMFTSAADGFGPREEILLSPELNLDDTYQLSFKWEAASASALNNKEYDLQVRIVVDGDVENAETVWSFQDADMLKASGVTTFPWTGWTNYQSKIGLEKYQGKNIKIAFVYKMLKQCANVAYIDDVTVSKYTPATAPVATLDKTLYNFGDVYMGEKIWSEVITLKNTGSNGLKINEVVCPNGFETTLKPEEIALDANEKAEFQIAYKSALTSATDDYVILKTTGGEVKIRVVANKVALPTDATFEGFENGVPPAGWQNKGWLSTYYALEGDYSAYCSPTMDGASHLTSPRLDLSTGEHSVIFTCFDEFDSDLEGGAPENDVTLEFSKDGGATWATVWTSTEVNTIQNVTVTLGTPASDNCYLRWAYSEVTFDYDNIPETSIFFLDRVLLPKVYGMGGVPFAATCISPADGAENIYDKNLELSWDAAQFATGYKFSMGTDEAASNLYNNVDLGAVTTFSIAKLQNYNTTYYWKVTPYNDKGETENVPTWSFTTIADPTISAFPYAESFEGEGFPPTGWYTNNYNGTYWQQNSIDAYDGKFSASVSTRGTEHESYLMTPDVALPADKAMEISFAWGNAMPVALAIDETGLIENTSTADNGIDACFFEINDGTEWKQLAIISDAENKYWFRERIDLSEYAGKTVTFRWRYVAHSYTASKGACVDKVVIAPTTDNKFTFSTTEWNAGKVNYGKSVTSKKTITIINEGNTAGTIEAVSFATENFTTDLTAGTIVEAGKAVPFTLTFNAKETAATVNDEMTVTISGLGDVKLPVSGIALAQDVLYYDFESDTPGSVQPTDFTTIDVDGKATLAMSSLNYPMRGAPFAFCVQKTEDWNNVFNPVSGSQVLVAVAAADYGSSEDWIISKKLTATADSRFNFYARNWNSVNSILPETQSSVEVLVSTTGTATADFTSVHGPVQMPYYDGEWEYFDIDLSTYAGKDVYIAVRHTVTDGLAAFFDDFTFEHFKEAKAGVGSLSVDKVRVYPNPATDVVRVNGATPSEIVITNLAGAVVAREANASAVEVADLNAGIYLMTVTTEEGTFTTKLVKK